MRLQVYLLQCLIDSEFATIHSLSEQLQAFKYSICVPRPGQIWNSDFRFVITSISITPESPSALIGD